MWRTLAVLLLAMMQEAAFHPLEIRHFDSSASLSCLVDDLEATPCRTMSYQDRSWMKGPWGIVTTESSHREGMRAWDRDGSNVEAARGGLTEYYVFRQSWNGTRIVRRDVDQAFALDNKSRTYFPVPEALHLGTEYWERDNSNCEVAASHFYFDNSHFVGRFTVGGVTTIRYADADSDGFQREVDFAPAFGCPIFKFRSVKRNWIGLTVSFNEFEITSYELGPPKRDLFHIPPGYVRREPPRQE